MTGAGTHYQVRVSEDPTANPLGDEVQVLSLSTSASQAAETLTTLWDRGLTRGLWATIVAVEGADARFLSRTESAEVERVYADSGRRLQRPQISRGRGH